MNTSLKILSLFCLIGLINACQQDNPKPADPDLAIGEVQFAFASVAKINSNGKSTVPKEFPSGSYLSINLLSAGESFDHNVSLIKLGDGYVSEPMTLVEAAYEITDFMIMNEEGDAIYATPKEASPLAPYVDDPLPVNFTVTQGELTNLNMEVVDVTGHGPGDFGYASFQIEIVPIPQFSLSVFIPKDGELQLTDAQGYILHEGDTIASENLEGGINNISFIGSPEGGYSLVVIKSGYGRYTKDFTLLELKDDFGNMPVKVTLDPAFTLVTPVNETFEIDLQGIPGKTLFVDWGDGNIETLVMGSEVHFLKHPYELIGSKFVAITGDISSIKHVSLYYDPGSTSSIHINHLTNLTQFIQGWTDTPSEIDFSDNLKLEVLMLDNSSSIQKLDISKNSELWLLDITATSIPSIDISKNSRITDLRISVNELISSAELDKTIESLISHSPSANPRGYRPSFIYGPNLPSATGMANLEILENEYGWYILYDDFVYR